MDKSNTPGTRLLSHLNSTYDNGLQITIANFRKYFSFGKLSVLPQLTNIITAVCDELK